MKPALVFLAAFATDWVWAWYIMYTAQKAPIKSALLSGVIMVIGAYITVAYLEDPAMLWVAVVGGMTGTYLSVRLTTNAESEIKSHG